METKIKSIEKKETCKCEKLKGGGIDAHGCSIHTATVDPEVLNRILKDQEKPPMLQVKSTKPIKLKDSIGRGGMQFNFMQDFGFIPEEIVISKVQGRNNVIVLSAILPEKVLLQEKNFKKAINQKGEEVENGR